LKEQFNRMANVLVIDDHDAVRTALRVALALDGVAVLEAATPAQALALIDSDIANEIDLVIQDMNFQADTTSGAEGIDLFGQIRARKPDMPIVLLTAWTHLEQAVQLVRAGAADYLQKPWDQARLLTTAHNLIELSQQRKALHSAQSALQQQRQWLAKIDLRGAIVESAAMQDLVRLAAKIAPAAIPVLITGPNGAGKECIAEIVHWNSAVRAGPFVSINCGAIPAELIEAELFGAEAGAYTGASKSREGRFDAADGGTLLLDEIGNLSLAGQMKLLRVLETGQYERLGSNKTRTAKVRVLSATNSDLPDMIAKGLFREDLYYRLNVIELRVPPLAARPEDVMPIALSLLAGQAKLSAAAQLALKNHHWPGNVRELKNAVTRARLLCQDGIIQPEDLGLRAAPEATRKPAPTNAEPTQQDIVQALQQHQGVIADAAHALGLTRQSLYRRMERFGISREAAPEGQA
jgi:DNA-binding NtrC family response regulator